jgi:hypothetical protein
MSQINMTIRKALPTVTIKIGKVISCERVAQITGDGAHILIEGADIIDTPIGVEVNGRSRVTVKGIKHRP